MKSKYLALVLVVVLILGGIAACSQAQNQEGQQEPQDLNVRQTEPVDVEEPADVEEPVETEPQDEPEASESVEPSETASPEEQEAVESKEPVPEEPEEAQLFEDCNETVYATGTVNIREETSTSSTKLGSLNKGDSITRIGIGLTGTTAEGWSKVQLSDGTIAYMVSSYLSTTKPATGGNGGGSGSGSGSGTQNPDGTIHITPPPSDGSGGNPSGQSGTVWDQAFYDTLTPEQQEAYRNMTDAARKSMQHNIEQHRRLSEEGWSEGGGYGAGDLDEGLMETWSHISVGGGGN